MAQCYGTERGCRHLRKTDDANGFTSFNVTELTLPVLVSVPHAGRDYPDSVFNNLRLPRAALLRLEDRYADLLVRNVLKAGSPAIIAHRARAWIDLNRDESDIDVDMVRGADRADYPQPGAKQRGGLGLVPRRLSGNGDLWAQPFEIVDIEQRIASFHRPYHAQVSDILAQMRAKFGVAILLDLHSMPPIRPSQSADALANGRQVNRTHSAEPPQFVVGDRFGQSAASQYAELLIGQIRMRGFRVALNHPYAGEYILRRHARPKANIHAIQLEVDRSLYLDSALREPGSGLAAIAAVVSDLVHALADQALGTATLIAAE